MSDAAFPESGHAAAPPPPVSSPVSQRDRIIEATMELAAERDWSDFGIADIASRAKVSLAEFRDAFPSKGAVLAGLSKKIDRIVLEGTTDDLAMEGAKERLFDVLMRRLDAMTPYKLGLEGVSEWVKTDAATALALNGVALNAMRFMCAAAGIDAEGRLGALKLQGLVLAWARIVAVWFEDADAGLARTMAALDRELERGDMLVRRVDDLDRLASPLRLLGRAMMDTRRRLKERRRVERPRRAFDPDLEAADPAI